MKKNLKKLIVLFTCLTILLSVSMVQVYAAPSISAKKVSVTDATGKTYYSKTFSSCAKNKEYSFQWNGKTSSGKNVEAGAYRICITAGTTKTYSSYLRVYAKTGFSGGNGSSSNPYKVSNLEQLRKISLYPK